jgi:hypothetical protein
MDQTQFVEGLKQVPDEVLSKIMFSMPWQYDVETATTRDPDGFDSPFITGKEDTGNTRELLQKVCWNKFQQNPQINTAVRGLVGRLAGEGFESSSSVYKIQREIENIEQDPRNRLYNFWPKYVGRSIIEGELFQSLTLHTDGFVEVDFIDPSTIGDGGTEDTGIIFHPKKTLMPLFYNIKIDGGDKEQVPSIFIARYPELISVAKESKEFKPKLQNRSRKNAYQPFRGYFRFIVSWDKGFVTRRAISYLRTTIQWLNHYEDLKKYEIDHKKSSGAYAWVFTFEDVVAFRLWLSLSDDDRKKTAVMQKMTPGSRLFLPPGMSLEAKNPSLTAIREQDTDILQMVTSGLNESSDVTTGTPSGSFSSIKATRAPMTDRVSDEIAYFRRFLIHDFWGSIFFLKSAINKFPATFKVTEAVDFKVTSKSVKEPEEDFAEIKYHSEPVFEEVERRPEELIDISFPVSETADFEGRARAFLGVKHGPIAETLGVPNEDVCKKLGGGNYQRLRLRKATEDRRYPKLVYNVDAESLQEKVEAEPSKDKKTDTKKTDTKKKGDKENG